MTSRVSYRERDRDYDDEPQRRTYTTVKRYQVPDRDSDRRSAIFGADDDVKEEKIIIKRTERRDDEIRSPRSEAGFRSERGSDRERTREEIDVRIRTNEREAESSRRQGASDYRVIEREREVVRAPSPPPEERVREFRYERERDYSPPRTRVMERDYDIERYSKTTDYYGQPQPIIIRESAPQPIIIREERRGPQQIIIRRDEPQFEFIEREEVRNDQALVVKEDPPRPASTVKSVVKSVKEDPQDEEYFYERRIREYRRNKDDIKPSDSASQYSSDDSYEYIRRERYVDDDRHHKLHLAEGALAGAAAAGIIRSHRKSRGQEDNHRGRDLLGGAALGAIGAEAISRAKSLRGSSRRREDDYDDDYRSRRGHRRDRSRSRSRSRSESKTRVGKLTGLAAVAAVGALAGYAIKKSGNNKETVIINDGHRHRSRSRRRRSSRPYSDDGRLIEDDKHRDPEHRNRRIAQAGLASAAAAGIWERMRSKSRGGRERSKSRIRTGIPIVGAGLGGAALAGLYEKHKASKEATRDAIIADERSRGRSRSRSRPRALDGRRDDPMVAYGNDPVYRDGYDEAPGSYRRRDRSAGSSPDTRHRSRSRARDLATAGAGALAGAAVARHAGRSRSRSRSRRRDHDRDSDYDDRYDDYRHGDYITPPPNGGPNYPTSNYFPPPPTGEQAAIDHDANYNAYPPYNPADYPPAAASAPRDAYSESNATLGAPNPHDTFAGDNRYMDPAHAAAEARERQEDREMRQAARTGDAGNVSDPPFSDRDTSGSPAEGIGTSAKDVQSGEPVVKEVAFQDTVADNERSDRVGREQRRSSGESTPRARSTSRVRFDLGSNVAHSPEMRHQGARESPSEESNDRPGRGSSTNDKSGNKRPARHHRPSSTLMNDPYERRMSRSESEDTEDLPARFDKDGNRRSETSNDLASRLSDMFSSRSSTTGRSDRNGHPTGGGAIEDMLKGLVDELFHGDEDDGRTGRRLRR